MNAASLLKQVRESGLEIKLSGENLELAFLHEHVDQSVIDLVKENKQEILAYLKSISTTTLASIPLAPYKDTYAITSTQLQLWVSCQLDAINSAYNLPVILKLEGDLNIALLKTSFIRLIERHEILRSQFLITAIGEVGLRVRSTDDVVLDVNVAQLPEGETLKQHVSKLVAKPFDLQKGPLLRVDLIQHHDNEHYLCLNIHHIISDAGSLEILLKELVITYNESKILGVVPLPPLKVQFKDYAEWRRNKVGLQVQEKYWFDNFKDEIPALNLPTYQPRPSVKTYNGAVLVHDFDGQIVQDLRAFSNKSQGTVFMTLMAALNGLLFSYTGQSDIILGVPVSGRDHPDLENQIGLYINTLPIRTRFDTTANFNALFAIQKDVLLKAYTNGDYPLGDLINNLNLKRDTSRSPLFDVLVTHQQSASTLSYHQSFIDLKTSNYTDYNTTVSKYDLTINFFESHDGLSISLEYNTDLFQELFILRFIQNLEGFLKSCIKNSTMYICRIPYLENNQLNQLASFNETALDYDSMDSVITLFKRRVRNIPNRVALRCESDVITYKDVDSLSTRLANNLIRHGVQPGDIVGICHERSIDMVIAMLGVLKSGAGYLPLDPFYPLDRLDYIIQHSETKLVVTSDATKNLLGKGVRAISLSGEIKDKNDDDSTVPALSSSSTAYVIYTSGSTGKPKGVQVSHRNLTNFIFAMNEKFNISEQGNVWLAMTSISFDISILELLWTLTRGDEVVIHPERPTTVTPKPSIDFSLFYFPTGNTDANSKYNLLLKGAAFADQNGFKAVWVPERHFHSFGDHFPNPSVAAAALSTITKCVKLRSGSVVLPLHDPVRVAEEWSMVDNLSGGRVELSIASGWHPNDFVLAPDDFNNRHQVMRDGIKMLKDLWCGKSVSRKNGVGKEFEFKIHPSPIQKEIPLWITAAGSVDTFKYAGSIGANLLTHLLGQSIDDLAEKIKAYRQARQENGFEPNTGSVALMLHTFVHDNEAYVRKTVEKPFKAYLRNSINLLEPIAQEEGLDVQRDVDVLVEMSYLRYYSTSSLFGTPESCMEITGKIFNAGVNEIGCLIDFGIDDDTVLSNLYHLNVLKERVTRYKVQYDFMLDRMNRISPGITASLIHKHNVTHIQSTPSFYEELLLEDSGRKALGQITTLLVGGEALSKSLAKKLIDLRGNPVHNMYGPTETTIWSSMQTIKDNNGITIGKPIANTQIFVLDKTDQLCPVGVPGELCISGDGVSLGYLNSEVLTAERFLIDPFVPQRRIYKTGDIARWLDNGELEYLGRLDRQVKVRGYRIELNEIENVILELPAITQCVVSTIVVNGQMSLVAYIKTLDEVTTGYLKNFLGLRVPVYMVPQYIISLKDFPVTPNGKIDVKRLPHPHEDCMFEKNHTAPRNEKEEQLAKIWQNFLNISTISIDDNFFEIGGNSMKAVMLVTIINAELNLNLKIITFFQYPTIRILAENIYQKKNANELPIQQNDLEGVDEVMNFMNNI